jgi:hypothetical protein
LRTQAWNALAFAFTIAVALIAGSVLWAGEAIEDQLVETRQAVSKHDADPSEKRRPSQ